MLGRVEWIEWQTDTEWSGIESLSVEIAHQLKQLLASLYFAYLLEVGLNWLVAHLIAAYAIHIQAIESANLLPVGSLRHLLLGVLHNQFLNTIVVQLLQVGKRTVLGMLLIQRIGLEPTTNGIQPEVVARFNTRVHVCFQILCRAGQTNKGHSYSKKHFFHTS